MKTAAVDVVRYAAGDSHSAADQVGVEEPLEIRLGYLRDGTRLYRNVVVTMRTPGDDADLAAGFLYTEGILTAASQIESIERWEGLPNILRVHLAPRVDVDWKRLERLTYAASSCGLCGKASIEMVAARLPDHPPADLAFAAPLLLELPARLAAHQQAFAATGSLHAAALFDETGQLLSSFEDVGRHNAVDKLIGAAWRAGQPFARCLMLVSGRAGFELVQKAAMAGLPVMAAVGAPSSLAVELADSAGLTLIGFLRDRRFNIYTSPHRIRP